MHRVLFHVPGVGITLYSFGASMLLACAGALWLTAWRARRERLNPDAVFELAIWLMTGGFIGARALYIVSHPRSIHQFADIFKVWQGGIVFYGCIIGGLAGSLIYWRRHPFPFRAMADAVAPSLALGSAIGRVGCFLNGCCYGAVSTLPWAISFPKGALPWTRHVQEGLVSIDAVRSLPVHPTQVYAALDGFFLLALLTVFYPRRRRDGEVMALLMVTYPVTRFLIEGLRGDEPALLLGMTMSQGISVVLFLGGLLLWAYLARQPKVRLADSASPVLLEPADGSSDSIDDANAQYAHAAHS
jgi:phosphatidylglycerol---prolipoprotein diacylglyceryl transferase